MAPLEFMERIKKHVYAFRIRVNEFFKDYDHLNCGRIPKPQFKRGVCRIMEKTLFTEDEVNELCSLYSAGQLVDYKKFTLAVDQVFQEPLIQHEENINSNDLLETVKQYVRHHNCDVKSWYKDFDKHNAGIITVNQYLRGFPANLLTMDEMMELLTLFSDSSQVNYFKFNNIVNKQKKQKQKQTQTRLSPTLIEHAPIGTESVLESQQLLREKSLPVLDHIKQFVFKKNIRTIDFFRDYDKTNRGLISKSQFLAGLKNIGVLLSNVQQENLIYMFEENDRIKYRLFSKEIQSVFTQDVDQNPCLEVHVPHGDELRYINTLSEADQAVFSKTKQRIQHHLHQKRIDFKSFFRDFDKNKFSQITKSQLSRVFSLCEISVDEHEWNVIMKKFQDPYHVNLLNFADSLAEVEIESKPKSIRMEPQVNKEKKINIDEILMKIEKHCFKKQIRVSEFMRDFDPLHSGTVSKKEFIRSLNQMGIMLEEPESELIASYYQDKKEERCRWRDLELDIQKGISKLT